MPVTICPESFLYLRIQRLKYTKHYSTDQIKKNEMGRACGTPGGDETFTCIQILERNPRRKSQMEDLGVNGRIILKRGLKKIDERIWTRLI